MKASLNTDFVVNQWRNAHNIKQLILDAQTIFTIIGTDSNVQYVNDNVFENKNGYQDLESFSNNRHYRIKNLFSRNQPPIAQCDCYFPELQYVFEPNQLLLSLSYLHIPHYDISKYFRVEVFDVVYEATKHRCSMDK